MRKLTIGGGSLFGTREPGYILDPIWARSVVVTNLCKYSPFVIWRVFGEFYEHLRQDYPNFTSSNGEPILLESVASKNPRMHTDSRACKFSFVCLCILVVSMGGVP